MKQKKEHQGMALITILLMMVILVMLTVSLITVNSNNLLYTLNYNSRVSALMAAESGVAYAIYELQGNSDWDNGMQSFTKYTDTGKFTIKFENKSTLPENRTSVYYSINNLNDDGNAVGYRGTEIYPHTADLIVTGQTGSTVRRIRVVLGRDNISEGGRCSGTAKVEAAKFIIQRATTAKDQHQGGSFHSNYRKPGDPNDPSIKSTISTDVQAFGGVISGCGGLDIPVYDANSGTQLRPNVEPKPIPDIDIQALVSSKSGVNPAPGGTYRLTQTTAGGNFELLDAGGNPVTIPFTYIDQATGELVFTKDVYFGNDVRFEFPMKDNHYGTAGIRLEKTNGVYPSLYINGSSTSADSFLAFGRVKGNGSIYSTGGTKFLMQTDLVASQDTGIELLSEGDININLPASRLSTINLNLLGAVLTHGNLNATVLDPNDPVNNPSLALPAGSEWPNDWVEQAYNNLVPSVPVPSATPTTVNIPSSGISMTAPDGKIIEFIPDGRASILAGQTNGQIVPSTATLTINANGTYTFGGTANFVHIYYNNFKCDQDTANSWVTNGTTIGNGTGDLHLNYWPCATPIGHYVTRNFFGSNQSAFSSCVYNTLVDYEQSLGGGGPAPSPGPVVSVSGDIYSPDIIIKGALVVTDPNNLNGLGPINTNAGNINIDLVSPKDKGDFTIVHSRDYEKLLASPEIRSKIVVNTWEELR